MNHPTAPHPTPQIPTQGTYPLFFRVVRRQRETHDTHTLWMEPPAGTPFAFYPGQFNMLYVFGVGEVPISISGPAHDPIPLIHTIRAVGAVTRALVNLKPGDIVGVRGPFGTSWPLEQAQGMDIVIVAGGIGLAPLRPALYHLLHHREKYNQVVLLYGARTPRDLLYRRELERWRGRFDMEVLVTVDRGPREWRGHVGVVTTLFDLAEPFFQPTNTVALVCGPEIMMRYTARELLQRGVPEERIFVSLERNMKCGQGFCGHCQFGPHFICKDGPVFPYPQVAHLMTLREV